MGGIGSGCGSRWSTKTTTDDVNKIDVRYMSKNGLLVDCGKKLLKWSVRGRPVGDIGFYYKDDTLNLFYKCRERGQDWRLVEQQVPIDYTPCNYGGQRPWFRCPRCSSRVAVLYGVDVLFLCRHCYKLPYESQQQGWRDRLITQKHKLGERTFAYYEYGEGYGKKKGMHWKTYERLLERYRVKESAYLSEMSILLKYIR